MKTILRLAAAAALLAACAPAAPPASAPGTGAVSHAGLLGLADRREWNEAYLRAAAASPDPGIRRRTAWVLANLRRKEAVPLLQPLLAAADTSVAAMAAFALGQIGDTSAVALLVPHASRQGIDTRPTVVGEAAAALGKLRHPAAKDAVQALLSFAPLNGPGLRESVGPALLGIWRQPRPLPVEPVSRWLNSQDPELRWRAAYALARRAEPAATAALYRNVRDPDAMVRSMVARSLTSAMADSSRIGPDAAQDALYRMVTGDTSQIVRLNALRTVGSYRTDRALRILADAITGGRDPYEVIVAMESLQRLGTYAAPQAALLDAGARDTASPVFVRQTALAALGVVDPRAALRTAREVAGGPHWRLRAAAARIYAADTTAREELMAAVADRDGRVAAAALEAALAADTTARTLRAVLLAGVQVRDVIARTNALTALAKLADPATLPVVLDAYQRAQADTLDDAALAAVDAVAGIGMKDPSAARQFFARFPRSGDYLVRQRVQTALGDSLAGSWGAPLPVETGMSMADYERVVAETAARPRPRVVIETSRGRIELELFADDAPLTVRSFLQLAEAGYFDGQEWPRVVPNFVVQGGDPRGDTSGGPGYSIRDEINRHLYLRGSLGMALSGPDTGGSQWFVTHSPQPHLDGTYAIFGRVVRGMEVADDILPGDAIIRIREVR
ncbi:MAG TPA: peptidylprolyl isomerase [Longimicrobium sp.]|nr:peptidylprolyl isomerase [Longimicrobium sp.]